MGGKCPLPPAPNTHSSPLTNHTASTFASQYLWTRIRCHARLHRGLHRTIAERQKGSSSRMHCYTQQVNAALIASPHLGKNHTTDQHGDGGGLKVEPKAYVILSVVLSQDAPNWDDRWVGVAVALESK
jgi:hypothetical protein